MARAQGEQCQGSCTYFHAQSGSQSPIQHPQSTAPLCWCRHPPHTCALSAAWGRLCGCSSRPQGCPHPRQRSPTAGCRRCPPPAPGRAADGAAGSPPPPCAPARPAPPAPRPGSAAHPGRAAAGGSGRLRRRHGACDGHGKAELSREGPGVDSRAENQLRGPSTPHVCSANVTALLP